MFKFIHAADIHLDSPLWGLERYEGAPVEEIRGATRRSLENLVSLAIGERVDFVLIAGDLYDGEWKDYNTALFLAKEFARLREEGIKVFAVTGNHDAASQITRSLRVPDNVTLFPVKKPETIHLDSLGVAIHGRSFAQRIVTDDLSATYPTRCPAISTSEFCTQPLPDVKGMRRMRPAVSKHWSRETTTIGRSVMSTRGRCSAKTPGSVFPGNTQGRHIRERGPKGCTLVTVEDDRSVTVEHRDLHVLEWALCHVDAEGAGSPEEIVERTRGLIEQESAKCDARLLAVRLCIMGPCRAYDELSAKPGKWINEIRSSITDASAGTVWLRKVEFRTRTQVVLEEALKRTDALGDLLRFIDGLDATDEVLAPLRDEMHAFRAKLPAEIFQGPDAIDLLTPEKVRETLEEAKHLLIPRLLSLGGGL